MAARPLIGWDIFDFFSETTEQNLTKLDIKQDINVLYKVCVFRADWKTRWPPWPLGEAFLTSPLKPLNGIQLNMTGSKISTSSIKFVLLGRLEKTRWLPWPLIGWGIFDFFSEATEWNSTKLDRKQDVTYNVLYQVCVFPASDWLRLFRLSLWNSRTEFNEIWQEARSQLPLPRLCFSSWLEKEDGRPGL